MDANGVETYKGIPYAAPTSGENRWRDPQPVVPWSGVKRCFEFGDITLQDEADLRYSIAPDYDGPLEWTGEYLDLGMTVENGMMSEDSLNLNVWTMGNEGDKLPVIVYIHGEGNTGGSSANEVYTGDIGYWMNYFTTTAYHRPWTDVDYNLGEIMSSYLVNFAATGDPNGNDSEGNPLPQWSDVASTTAPSYLRLDDTVEFVR